MKLRLDPNIWLVLALSVFAWGPLLTPAYFFEAHDARHSVFFLVEFDQTFRDGYLWPRWSPDLPAASVFRSRTAWPTLSAGVARLPSSG